jgi:hypothetical protein
MGRPPRADEAGAIYHMLNRANRRAPMFLRGPNKTPHSETMMAPKSIGTRFGVFSIITDSCASDSASLKRRTLELQLTGPTPHRLAMIESVHDDCFAGRSGRQAKVRSQGMLPSANYQ